MKKWRGQGREGACSSGGNSKCISPEVSPSEGTSMGQGMRGRWGGRKVEDSRDHIKTQGDLSELISPPRANHVRGEDSQGSSFWNKTERTPEICLLEQLRIVLPTLHRKLKIRESQVQRPALGMLMTAQPSYLPRHLLFCASPWRAPLSCLP